MSLFRPQLWKIPEISDAERRRLPELAAALERRLQDIAVRYPQAVFASSLAVEDMVITDAAQYGQTQSRDRRADFRNQCALSNRIGSVLSQPTNRR